MHKIKRFKLVAQIVISSLLISSVWAAPVEGKTRVDSVDPLLKSTSPILGASGVRLDQDILFQLNPAAKSFPEWSGKLGRGQVTGYLWDGVRVIQVNSDQIRFDAAANTVTLHHPLIDRYKQYAAILQVGDAGKINWFERTGNKFSDVITDLDPVSGTVTLLGHGKVRPQKGWADLQIGDVVEAHTSGDQFFLDSRHDDEITALFRTGSALHEATHITAQVEQPKVRVTDGGYLLVHVVDDYGLPATNATVHVSAGGSNLVTTASTIGPGQNGESVLPLTDHVKETVHLTVTAQDNTYHDSVDTQTAQAVEQFLAGAPDHLTVLAGSPLTVGQQEPVTGIVYDRYNNTCEDDTVVQVASSAGGVTPQEQNTVNGTYDFQFTAPTKVQDVTITASSSGTTGAVVLHLQPDQLSNLVLTPEQPVVTAGQNGPVTITATDRYGNPIPHADLTIAFSGSATGTTSVTTDQNGSATLLVQDTKAEVVTITATAPNGVSGSTLINVVPDQPAHLMFQTDRPEIPADGNTLSTTWVEVTDQFGNPIPNTDVTLSSSSQAVFPGIITTDETGRAVFTVKDGAAETAEILVMANDGLQGIVTLTVNKVLPPITSDNLVTWEEVVQPDGTIVVTGTILDEHGQPCPNFALPVVVTGGWVDGTPGSDANGNFSFVLHRTSSDVYTSVSLPMADNRPELVFAPPISDWTDTGIDLEPGQLITLGGASGYDVSIGGVEFSPSGTFSTGTSGRLYVRGSNQEVVNMAVISIEAECDHYQPLLQLTADPTILKADGSSKAVISGQAFEVAKDFMQKHVLAPVVNGEITLALTADDGTLENTTVITDSDGHFSTTYTAGQHAGTVSVVAMYRSGSASTTITLEPTSALTIPEFQTIVDGGHKIVYVDANNGDDTHDGLTPATAVKTINHAVDISVDGDGIFMAKGVYREKSNKQFWDSPRKYSAVVVDKSVTIIGEDIDETVILVDDQNAWFVGNNDGHILTFTKSNIKVKNLTVRLNTSSTTPYLLINDWGDSWSTGVAKNCTLENILIEAETKPYSIFYMNQSNANLNVHDVTIKTRNQLTGLVYTNSGNIIFDHSLIDTAYRSLMYTGQYTNIGSYFSVSPSIFTDYANDDLHQNTYPAGAYYGTYYDNGTQYVVN